MHHIYKNIIFFIMKGGEISRMKRELDSQGTTKIQYIQNLTSSFCLHEVGTGPT